MFLFVINWYGFSSNESLPDSVPYIDELQFFKNNIPGAICDCAVRKAIANNEFCENYDQTPLSNYIMYLDTMNSYVHNMSLPTGHYQWMSTDEIDNIDVLNIDEYSNYGYDLEVDTKYTED